MKATKNTLIAIVALMLSSVTMAQSKWGHGEDSVKALTNFSLFVEYAKQKNYDDALAPWSYVYENVPSASKNIYIYGVSIVKNQIKKAKTGDEQQKYVDKLMEVYDQRIKYFGNDRKYPEAYILSKKALDYYQLRGKKIEAKKTVFDWLGQSIDGLGVKSSPITIQYYSKVLFELYAEYAVGAEEVIDSYAKIMGLLDNQTKAMPSKADDIAKLKEALTTNFASSGAADCDAMEEMFGDKIETNKEDLEMLTKVLDLFDKVGCTESGAYYKASEYIHAIQPSAASAAGVANSYVVRELFDEAIQYLEQAIELEEDAEKRSKYKYSIAGMLYSKKEDMVGARKYARAAIKDNRNYGAPYILIGTMYAQSAANQKIGSKDIENLAGYWAAVDKFVKAKSVDPEAKAEADKFIAIYSNYFPNQEMVFFEPDYTEGKTVTVGGWIQEKTKVRSKK